jgi:hypothetical protein
MNEKDITLNEESKDSTNEVSRNGSESSTNKKSSMKDVYFKQMKKALFLETPKQLSNVYHMEEDLVYKVILAIDSIIELYSLFGCEKPEPRKWFDSSNHRTEAYEKFRYLKARVNHSRYKTIHLMMKFVEVNGETSWVKFFKWKFAAYFAYVRQEDIPERPDFTYEENVLFSHIHFLGGSFHDFLVSLKANNPNRYMQFVDSTQQLKKSMPAVSKSMIEKAEKDTMLELTLPKDEILQLDNLNVHFDEVRNKTDKISELYNPVDFVVCMEDVKLQLRRTVTEIFQNEELRYSDIIEPFFPSTSGNYNWVRRYGGTVGLFSEYGLMNTHDDFRLLFDIGEQSCSFSHHVAKKFGNSGRHEQVLLDMDREAGLEQPVDGSIVCVDFSSMQSHWRSVYFGIWEKSLSEIPYVKTVGLAEPLKVRVISKGPPATYFCLKPIQKWLWSVLKKHSCFNLIGRYVTEEDVNNVLGDLKPFEIALSGDYVSSTNKLHSWVSETILDQLMIEIGENMDLECLSLLPANFLQNLKTKMLDALTKHIFCDEVSEKEMGLPGVIRQEEFALRKGKLVKEDKFYRTLPQTEGQLMGSIVSFPFLCIANAALCRYALELSDLKKGKRFRLINQRYDASGPIAPLLVNGDDCLLKGVKGRLRPCWEQVCSIAGLMSSLGKTYFSNNFCTINSTIFEINLERKWFERKYINLGLMMGRSRASGEGGINQIKVHQLGVICRELKRSCPVELWPSVKKRFLYYNMKELTRFPGIPWYLPEWLGGIGLPIDHPDELGDTDRKAAYVIKRLMNDSKHKKVLKPCLPKEAEFWIMHKRVMKDLDSIKRSDPVYSRIANVDSTQYSLTNEFARVYKYMTISQLFTKKIEDLWTESGAGDCNPAMKHNVRVHSTARKLLGQVEFEVIPMTDEDLKYENKDVVSFPCFVTEFSFGEYYD